MGSVSLFRLRRILITSRRLQKHGFAYAFRLPA
jgi:hypothetical protein